MAGVTGPSNAEIDFVMFSTFTLAWFAIAIWLSRSDRLSEIPSSQLLAAGLAFPFILSFGLPAIASAFENWTNGIPVQTLTLLQTPRVLGGSFILWSVANGRLPGGFGWPTGISDVAIGLSAPLAAFFLISKAGEPRRGLLMWQLVSMACLLVSSISGMVTSPESLSRYPLSLVPIFFGPLMIFLQLTGIRRTMLTR